MDRQQSTMTYLSILFVFLTACAPTLCVRPTSAIKPAVDVQQIKYDWAHTFGALPASCSASVQFIDSGALECGAGNAGCFVSEGCPHIAVNKNLRMDRGLAVHEVVHWILYCSEGRGDHEHTRADVWGPKGFVAKYSKQ